ncbi:unnamed protein product [Linum trigynum]|uniref:Extensin-like n=1 Tax=Linum trigynum TaxID=586398 RepID=A0AAV2FDS8_9ROSI
MPAPPPPPVQVDVSDPPPPYERKPSKRVQERPIEPEVTPYPGWKVPPPLVVPQGVGPSSPQVGGPSSPQGAGPSSSQTGHQGSYYDPRATYHQTPPSATPISYNDPPQGSYYEYRPIYPPSPRQGGYHDYRPVYPPSPRQGGYHDYRPVYPPSPRHTSSGTWHDGSSATEHHDFTPWARPHQQWIPTTHRTSVDVPRSTPDVPIPRRHSTDDRQTTTARVRNLPPPPPIVTPVGRRTRSKKTVGSTEARGLS